MLTLKIVLLKIVMRISLRFNTLRYCISNKIHKNMRYVLSNTIKNGFVLKALYKDCAIVANSDIVCRVKFIYPWIFNEVFGFNIYKFYKPLEVSRQYSVIDIGANVGYAALYFAQQSWCKQVLSFELFPQNIRAMQENLALNSPSIQQKVILYPYGLGKKENIKSGGGIMASYFEHRDGISSMNKDFVRNYAPEEESKEIVTRCEIRSASETLKRLVDDYKLTNIIVKIDVEGAEYEIFEDLAMHYPEFFQKVVKIVGDTHLGFDRFMDIIKPFGFEVVFKEPHADLTCPFELERICK